MQISSQSLAHWLEIIQETGESWNLDKETKHEILATLNTRKLILMSGRETLCALPRQNIYWQCPVHIWNIK